MSPYKIVVNNQNQRRNKVTMIFEEGEFEDAGTNTAGTYSLSVDLAPYKAYVSRMIAAGDGKIGNVFVTTGELNEKGRGKLESQDAKHFQEAARQLGHTMRVQARNLPDGRTQLRLLLTEKREMPPETIQARNEAMAASLGISMPQFEIVRDRARNNKPPTTIKEQVILALGVTEDEYNALVKEGTETRTVSVGNSKTKELVIVKTNVFELAKVAPPTAAPATVKAAQTKQTAHQR